MVGGLGIPALTIGTDFTGALMLVLPIEREFAADITTSQWVLNIYALTFAMGMVTAGRLADLFGRRRLLLTGMAVFIIDRFGGNIADQIAGAVREAFVSGLHQAYWLPLVMAVIGIFVALALDDEKLTQVNA
jgi:MFS family permease